MIMPHARRGRTEARQGFTLIELLIVVAIIAILAAMLLPALQRAKEASRRSVCMSNQRQLVQALIIYSQDSGGPLPSGWVGMNSSLSHQVRKYPGSSAPEIDADGWHDLGRLYGMKLIPEKFVYFCPSTKMDDFKYPFAWETGTMFGGYRYTWGNYWYRLFGQEIGALVTSADIDVWKKMNIDAMRPAWAMTSDVVLQFQRPDYRWPHEFGINVTYSDGHAEWIQLDANEHGRSLTVIGSIIATDYYAYLFFKGLDNRDFSALRSFFPYP